MTDAKTLILKSLDKATPGDVIRAFRQSFNVSQDELKEITGVSNLSDLENGRRDIGLDVAVRIAAFFGISPSRILFPAGFEKELSKHRRITQKAKQLLKDKIAI